MRLKHGSLRAEKNWQKLSTDVTPYERSFYRLLIVFQIDLPCGRKYLGRVLRKYAGNWKI